MKIPLRYQLTEYDCGPTSVENAISYLFHREELPPIIMKQVTLFCMDSFNSEGEFAKGGTSRMAMSFLSTWLNQYGQTFHFPIHCESLLGEAVSVVPSGRIMQGLREGGVVVLRLRYECWHYVLLTGADAESVRLFDPYYRTEPFETPRIRIVLDRPTQFNRRVPYAFLDTEKNGVYALGPKAERDAVIFFHTDPEHADPEKEDSSAEPAE